MLKYVSSNRWHVFLMMSNAMYSVVYASGTVHAREHVVRLSALAPPIRRRFRKLAHFVLLPFGQEYKVRSDILHRLRYARASCASCLSFALHAPVPARSDAECPQKRFPRCRLHGVKQRHVCSEDVWVWVPLSVLLWRLCCA